MGWIDDYKGEGPWDFTPQRNKPHYNEGNLISDSDNPVWELDHLNNNIPITPTHHPWCGYWPVLGPAPIGIIDADIFVIQAIGEPTIYGVNFDGKELSWVGSYLTPGVDTNGLILYEGDLFTVAGAGGASAELRRISTTAINENLHLLNTYNPFNSYDVRTAVNTVLVNGDLGKFYYSDTTTVMVSVHDLIRNKRGFRNTVITGTDSNLYVVYAGITSWHEDWHPITGGNWTAFWHLIEDNVCDTTVGAWGGDLVHCASGQIDMCYHNGYFYTVDFASVVSPITKINPSTLATVARYYNSSYAFNRITAHGSKIYAISGIGSCDVHIFNASDLSEVYRVTLPDGRAPNGDMEVVGNYLIVSTTTYTSSISTLYKLSLDNLNILDSVLTTDGTDPIGGQRLAKIDDTYIAVAWNSGISVYNTRNMTLVDKLSLTDIVGIEGYFAQAMVVKQN